MNMFAQNFLIAPTPSPSPSPTPAPTAPAPSPTPSPTPTPTPNPTPTPTPATPAPATPAPATPTPTPTPATPTPTPTPVAPSCTVAALFYGNSGFLACNANSRVTTYNPEGDSGPVANGVHIYSNSTCNNPAPSRWYADLYGIYGFWNGSNWGTSGLCE